MVRINAGTFMMGSPGSESGRESNGTNETQHSVTLSKAFFIGVKEVINQEYIAVMSSTPSNWPGSALRPTDNVTWRNAIDFCNALSVKEGLTPVYSGISNTSATCDWNANGYRLPTEAEWEYACRAGTTTPYSFGSSWSDTYGWGSGNSDDKTHDSGQKSPNPWGLYDMHGNVAEWCWDQGGTYSSAAVTDPRPSGSSNHVMRGGDYGSNSAALRSAARNWGSPTGKYTSLGFRVVRNAQ
jgi:formylglycine-generating enzyme required for sulfatase activity